MTHVAETRQTPDPFSHERRLTILGVLLLACIVSTAAHFSHNYLEIEHYPQFLFSNSTVRVGIIIAWPALTAVGLFGFWLYNRRRYVAAFAPLALYSLLGIITPAHFLGGSPHIPPFWYATIFTDALLGLAILTFARWSAALPPGRLSDELLTAAGK